MATASETIADIVVLRKLGNLSFYEGYISQNRISGVTYTNPIYQVPSGKYAEVIIHVWDDATFSLGNLYAGTIDESTNTGYRHARYNLLSPTSDQKIILDENMYIWRATVGSATGVSSTIWDFTIILRNKP